VGNRFPPRRLTGDPGSCDFCRKKATWAIEGTIWNPEHEKMEPHFFAACDEHKGVGR